MIAYASGGALTSSLTIAKLLAALVLSSFVKRVTVPFLAAWHTSRTHLEVAGGGG